MLGRRKKKWDDYIKKMAVCTPDFTTDYPAALPATPGKAVENESFPFDDFAEMAMSERRFDHFPDFEPMIGNQAQRTKIGFKTVKDRRRDFPRKVTNSISRPKSAPLVGKKNMSAEERGVPKLTGVAGCSFRKLDAVLENCDHVGHETKLKTIRSTPSLVDLSRKYDSGYSKTQTPARLHGTSVKTQNREVHHAVGAHIRFLIKIRKAEKLRMKREMMQESSKRSEKVGLKQEFYSARSLSRDQLKSV